MGGGARRKRKGKGKGGKDEIRAVVWGGWARSSSLLSFPVLLTFPFALSFVSFCS
jgi:hypothetical protein